MIWLAEKYKWAWHLNLFSRTRVNITWQTACSTSLSSVIDTYFLDDVYLTLLSFFSVLSVSKGNLLDFYFTSLQLVLSAVKRLRVLHQSVDYIFYFLWKHWIHSGYFENRILLQTVLWWVGCGGGGGVRMQLGKLHSCIWRYLINRVSDFRSFLCFCF